MYANKKIKISKGMNQNLEIGASAILKSKCYTLILLDYTSDMTKSDSQNKILMIKKPTRINFFSKDKKMSMK